MREILFKAKKKDNGEWVEGSLIKTKDNAGFILQSKTKAFVPRGTNTFCSVACYEIDINTVCQYTGLTDKNGKRIWENDIVEVQGEDGYFTCEWDDYTARFVLNGDGFTVDFDNYWGYQVEYLGNIFDNSELLEVETCGRFL